MVPVLLPAHSTSMQLLIFPRIYDCEVLRLRHVIVNNKHLIIITGCPCCRELVVLDTDTIQDVATRRSIHLACFNFSRIARLLSPTRHFMSEASWQPWQWCGGRQEPGMGQINRAVTTRALRTNDEGVRNGCVSELRSWHTHARLVLSLVKPVNVKFRSLWCLLVHKLTGRQQEQEQEQLSRAHYLTTHWRIVTRARCLLSASALPGRHIHQWRAQAKAGAGAGEGYCCWCCCCCCRVGLTKNLLK